MSVAATVKCCSKCGGEKPLDEFYRRASSPDGRGGWCKPCARGYFNVANRRWRDENRDRDRANQRRRYQSDPERHREYKRRYDAQNRDKVNARARERARAVYATPEGRAAALEKSQRRRALLAAGERVDLTALYAMACRYCGSTRSIEADHVLPLSRGGEHRAGNLAPACAPCNRSKKDRLPWEWPELEMLR